MRFTARRFLTLTGAALVVAALGACSDNTTTEPTTVSAPTGVAATATSTTTIQVTWSQVSGATAYEVDRATGAAVGLVPDPDHGESRAGGKPGRP